MDLLEKFARVEIRADTRITEADRVFCQKHQQAYQAALALFRQLLTLWRDGEEQQRLALRDPEDSNAAWSQYLTSKKFPALGTVQIRGHIAALHRTFIESVTTYLNATYHLTIDADMVEEGLIPSKENDQEEDNNTGDPSDLLLQYEDIIELVLSWFNGRSFS